MVDKLKRDSFFHEDSVPVVVARRDPQPEFPRHRHQFSELVIVTGGTGIHAIRSETYPVAAGDVFVIADNSAHEYTDMHNLSLINILYDPEKLEMSKWDVRKLPGYHALFTLEPTYRKQHRFESRLRISMNDLSHVNLIIDRLELELEEQNPGYRLMSISLFMQIACMLSRSYEKSNKSASQELLRIGEAISHMEEHWSENVTLEQLADIAHMSRRNFTRVFRSATGHSPNDHLIRLRITHATELLTRTELSITETAFKSGFQDSNYFARQFRKITGLSPTEYRKTR